MFGIGHLLERIQNSISRDIVLKGVVVQTIKKVANIDIEAASLVVKGQTIIINNVSPTAKSVIFIKKTMILNEINVAQSFKKLSDIK